MTARSSTIFVATEDDTKVYRSLEEVPAPIRLKLDASTRSHNSATILIADKRGREELVRALQGLPSRVECRLAQAVHARRKKNVRGRLHSRPMYSFRRWLDFLVPFAVGASVWYLAVSLHR